MFLVSHKLLDSYQQYRVKPRSKSVLYPFSENINFLKNVHHFVYILLHI